MRVFALLTLMVLAGALPAVTHTENPGVAIPDNNAFGVASQLTIPPTSDRIYSLRVGVRITHTYTGDLTLWMLPPGVSWAGPYATTANGATVPVPQGAILLSAKNGGSGDNYGAGATYANFKSNIDPITPATAAIAGAPAPFTAQTRYIPTGVAAWNQLFGSDPSGTWTLIVADGWALDTGTLNSWQIEYLTAPAGVLAVGRGGANMPGQPIQPGSLNQVAGQLALSAGSNISVTSVTLQAENSVLLNGSFSRVALHEDLNANGVLDSGENAVFTGTVAANANITLTSAPAAVVSGGTSRTFLIVVDTLASPAALGVAFRIVAQGNINSTGSRFGVFPLNFGYHHFGPARSFGSAPLIGLEIRNNYGPGVTDTITIPPTDDRLGALRVGVRLIHDRMQDMELYLIPPGVSWSGPFDGTPPPGVIMLSTNNGGNGDHMGTGAANGPYVYAFFSSSTDAVWPAANSVTVGPAPYVAQARYQPELQTHWNALYGTDPSGAWTLAVCDDATGGGNNGGTLVSWYIEYRARQRAEISGDGAFGQAQVGALSAGSPQQISVSNPGDFALSISGIGFSGTHATDFALAAPISFPVNVPAGGVFNFGVNFAPGAVGARNAQLEVTCNHNGVANTVRTLPLSGLGVAGLLMADSPVDYGSTNIGVATAAQAHTIHNLGAGVLTISGASFIGANAGDWAFQPAPTFPIVIAPLGNAQLFARFLPSAAGARSATLRLISDTSGVALTASDIALTGFAMRGLLDTATPVAYGSSNLHVPTAVQIHTLTNNGDGPLTIAGAAFTGSDAADWAFVGPTGLPTVLAPLASVQFSARLTPSATGLRQATLVITSDAGGVVNAQTNIAVTGTGTTGLVSTNLNVSYGSSNLGVASAVVIHTITNIGDGPLNVQGASFTGGNASDWQITVAPTWPVQLAPLGTLQIHATMTPSATGPRASTLRAISDAGGVVNAQTEIVVTGTGTAGALSTSLNVGYGSVNIHQPTSSITHTFVNAGDGNLSVTGVQFLGADHLDWSVVGTPSFPMLIAPALSNFIQAILTPSATGPRSATLRVFHDAFGAGGFTDVAVSGTGTAGVISAASPVGYGSGFTGTASSLSPVTHTISNLGDGPLTIGDAFFTGGNASDWAFTSAPSFPIVIPAGLSHNLIATLTPSSVGPVNSTLRILSDSGGTAGHFNIGVTGTGIAPSSVTGVSVSADDGGPLSVSATVSGPALSLVDVVVSYTGGIGSSTPVLVSTNLGTIAGSTIQNVPAGSLLQFVWDAYATEGHTSDTNYVITLTPFLGALQGQPGSSAPFGLSRAGGWASHTAPWEVVPPVYGHAAVFDATNDRLIVFSGRRANAYNSETWAWQRSGAGQGTWRRLETAGLLPPGRQNSGAVYDAPGNRMIVFGGQNFGGMLNDTWALDLTPGAETWTRLALSSPATPAPRRLMAMAIEGSRVLMHGGLGAAVFNDLWSLDLASGNWGTGPVDTTGPERYGHACAYDPIGNRMVYTCGSGDGGIPGITDTTWQLSLPALSWSLVGTTGTPGKRMSPTWVHDSINNRLILQSGSTGTGYVGTVWALGLSGAGINTWTQLPVDPSAQGTRIWGGAVIDTARQQAVIYGGFDTSAAMSVLSVLDLGTDTWQASMSAPVASPQARSGATMIFDSIHDRAVLFGGRDASTLYNDVWVLDRATPGAMWQRLDVTGVLPAGRHLHAAAFDAVNHRLIVMGGASAINAFMNDVWTLDLTNAATGTWTEHASTLPRGRARHAIAYDSLQDRLLLQAGTWNSAWQGDTWAYSFATASWTQLFANGQGAGYRIGHAAMFDSVLNRLIVYGGASMALTSIDVWALDLNPAGLWSNITPLAGPAPSSRGTFGAAANATGTSAWLFSGAPTTLEIPLGEMWRLDVAGGPAMWTQLALPAGGPMIRSQHAACFDGTHYLLAAGLVDGIQNGRVVRDAWEIEVSNPAAGFAPLALGAGPAAFIYPAAALDAANRRMIVFGGAADNLTTAHTWSLDLGTSDPQWQRLNISGPAARERATLVYDAPRSRMVLFGGRASSDATAMNDLWELSLGASPAWTQLAATGTGPSPRSGHTAIVDGAGRMIVFAGALANGVNVTEVFALDLATLVWTQLTPAGSTLARWGAQAIYDPVGNRMLVYGGFQGGPRFGLHALSLGGSPAWSNPVTGGINIPERHSYTMVYDPAGHRALLFGGMFSSGAQNILYQLDLGTSTWSQVNTPVIAPQHRYAHAAVWDAAGGRMVIAGGLTDGALQIVDRHGRVDIWYWGD